MTKKTLDFFKELAQIPRPSNHEEEVRNWLKKFALEHGLKLKQDAVGNLLISKSAQNSNSTKTVMIQSHMDMVCEKDPEKQHDFFKDPITLVQNGDWLYADQTTLGADNGIGLCMTLEVLVDKDISHPEIQTLFTMDEETGMVGVLEMEKTLFEKEPDYCLNLDSEESDCVYISCAGSLDYEMKYNFQSKDFDQTDSSNTNLYSFELDLRGFRGGHSGVDINTGRLNSIKQLNEFLLSLQDSDLLLKSFSGGNLRNAIPRFANVSFLSSISPSNLETRVAEFLKQLKIIENNTELVLHYHGKVSQNQENPNLKQNTYLNKQTSKNALLMIQSIESGVIEMSEVVAGLVQTSNNLAFINLNSDSIKITCMTRSSQTEKNIQTGENIMQKFLIINEGTQLPTITHSTRDKVVKFGNFEYMIGGLTPGWPAKSESYLLSKFQEVHINLFNKPALELAIHAGLECGVLSQYFPEMEIISFGPDIVDAHTPKERVNLISVERAQELLIKILGEL